MFRHLRATLGGDSKPHVMEGDRNEIVSFGALGQGNLSFTDVATNKYELEGIVRWEPPLDISQVVDLQLWMVPGQARSGQAPFLESSCPYGPITPAQNWFDGLRIPYNATQEREPMHL